MVFKKIEKKTLGLENLILTPLQLTHYSRRVSTSFHDCSLAPAALALIYLVVQKMRETHFLHN
jgi:hypothetical protein